MQRGFVFLPSKHEGACLSIPGHVSDRIGTSAGESFTKSVHESLMLFLFPGTQMTSCDAQYETGCVKKARRNDQI